MEEEEELVAEHNLALKGETHDNAGAGPFQCTRA